MKIIKNNKFIITLSISLFVVGSVGAFQQKQTTINLREIFQAIENHADNRAAQLIQEAIKSGVNLDDIKNNNGYTSLIRAAYCGNKEIVKLLLDSHVNPDIKNNLGDTALIWAATNGNKEIVKLLLDFHANPDIKDGYSNTALIWAVSTRNEEITKLLLDSHANPDIKNNYGNTALIRAASTEDKEIVKLLLDSHANPDIKNNENKTVLNIAQENGFHEIAEIIINELKRRREFVKKEVNEHLIADLACLVAEYIIFCPKESTKETL